ncbi:MAG: IS66 family insertion sequence element accessory protein TnpB [Bacillota bacterium]|nr:IS66 family insertion sequence element accessory protein TnpB [Bacillota bacterium]
MSVQTTDCQIYIAPGATDLRLGLVGLSAIVQARFGRNPLDRSLYVFCNRSRTRLKIIHWDGSGFWLHQKQLDRGRFAWLQETDLSHVEISASEFAWLVHGIRLIPRSAEAPSEYILY